MYLPTYLLSHCVSSLEYSKRLLCVTLILRIWLLQLLSSTLTMAPIMIPDGVIESEPSKRKQLRLEDIPTCVTDRVLLKHEMLQRCQDGFDDYDFIVHRQQPLAQTGGTPSLNLRQRGIVSVTRPFHELRAIWKDLRQLMEARYALRAAMKEDREYFVMRYMDVPGRAAIIASLEQVSPLSHQFTAPGSQYPSGTKILRELRGHL